MSITVAMLLGDVIHSDWTYPAQEKALPVHVGIEAQGDWWTAGVRGAPSHNGSPMESYLYAGVGHDIHISKKVKVRPTLAAGAYYEQEPRHPWHDSLADGWSPRAMLQLEVSYEHRPGASIGAYVSKITTLDNFNDRGAGSHKFDLWDRGGSGIEVGVAVSWKVR